MKIGLILINLLTIWSISMAANNRPEAFAGAFYPREAKELRKMIDNMLNDARTKVVPSEVFGMVVPHAGYAYSGPVAAECYSAIRGKQYDDVIIIAPSHRASFRGNSIFSGEGYSTPLGLARVDAAFGELIYQEAKSEFVKFGDEGHAWRDSNSAEHSLEVQIPFLQVVLPDVPIVPIVMGTQDTYSCSELANGIARALKVSGRKVLIVASSDLSHYKTAQLAKNIDSHFIDCFENFDYFRLQMECSMEKAEACGWGPVSVMMMLAEHQGGRGARILKYANSADSPYAPAKDSSRVVGYMAGIITSDAPAAGLADISDAEKATALRLAKENVESLVRTGKRIAVPENLPEVFSRKAAAFVTINKNNALRGCIGHTIASIPLAKEIIVSSASAAKEDYRFGEIREKELNELSYEISILTRMKRVFSFDEIKVGRHGLYIRYSRNSGILLPQVAEERKWTVKEFLENVSMKAGIPRDFYQKQEAELFSFEAIVIK